MKLQVLSFITACTLSLTPVFAQTTAAEVPIFTSQTYVAPNTKEQHYEGNLTLVPGQENAPLMLLVKNGGDGKRGFNWFRINIAGYLMASEQDIPAGHTQGAIDVTGRMQPGTSQIMIDAAGEPGATLQFRLLSPPVSLQSVEPSTVNQGQTIVLAGQNFNGDETQDAVLLNGKPITVLSASPTSITARVPKDAKVGLDTVQAVVNGYPTRRFQISVGSKPLPVLYSSNYWMAPPGAVLTIRGANFGPTASDNKVFFRNVPGKVVYASPTRIQVVIPNWGYGPQELNIPMYVVADGLRSGNFLRFDIGPKYLGALPPMPGDGESQASSQASSEAGWPLDANSEATVDCNSEASF